MKNYEWQFVDRAGCKTIVNLTYYPENHNRPFIIEVTQRIHTIQVQQYEGAFGSGDMPFNNYGFTDWTRKHMDDIGIEFAKLIGRAAN